MYICDKDNFKQAYNDVDNYTYYEINLNKTYSYKELFAKIKEVDTSYKVEFYDSNIENEISSSSEETIKSGEWILISIDKIIKGTSIPENDHIYLRVK